MPQDIVFPDTPPPSYRISLDALSFPALADGKPVDCIVTAELLLESFGAKGFTESHLMSAFFEQREAIQTIARTHIENGWIDEGRQVLLTTRFTRLTVIFSERFEKRPAEHALADTAHHMLLEIIGPTAGEVTVEWGCEELYGEPLIALHISDPGIRRKMTSGYRPKAWQDLSSLRVLLARAWSALLSARSQNMILKSG